MSLASPGLLLVSWLTGHVFFPGRSEILGDEVMYHWFGAEIFVDSGGFPEIEEFLPRFRNFSGEGRPVITGVVQRLVQWRSVAERGEFQFGFLLAKGAIDGKVKVLFFLLEKDVRIDLLQNIYCVILHWGKMMQHLFGDQYLIVSHISLWKHFWRVRMILRQGKCIISAHQHVFFFSTNANGIKARNETESVSDSMDDEPKELTK